MVRTPIASVWTVEMIVWARVNAVRFDLCSCSLNASISSICILLVNALVVVSYGQEVQTLQSLKCDGCHQNLHWWCFSFQQLTQKLQMFSGWLSIRYRMK